jgi:hypothetical protein
VNEFLELKLLGLRLLVGFVHGGRRPVSSFS